MLHAVLTGDVVASSKIKEERPLLNEILKNAFQTVQKQRPNLIAAPFDIFRGDSFQGVLAEPEFALQSSLLIRALLRSRQPEQESHSWDARIAIGIGTIEYLAERGSEGDGEAYRRSGPRLDTLKGEHRLSIQTPWDALNEEMETEAALLDAIIAKWSPAQAETIIKLLEDKVQKQIAKELGVSQAAVHYRAKGAGWFAVEKFLDRYKTVIQNQLAEKA